MRVISYLAIFLCLSVSAARATEDVTLTFMGGPVITLPGDCIYSINNSTYLCSYSTELDAHVSFPNSDDISKSFAEQKKAVNLVYIENRNIGKYDHFSLKTDYGDSIVYQYIVCDVHSHCIHSATSNPSFNKELFRQISSTLLRLQ